jgi:hypothetical protein
MKPSSSLLSNWTYWKILLIDYKIETKLLRYCIDCLPISAKLSNETQEVVPNVAETKNGINPRALSSSIALKNKINIY